jgi:hypothetical protein
MRFEVFKAVKIQVEVFWVVTPCGVVVRYQRFIDGHDKCYEDDVHNYRLQRMRRLHIEMKI